ncbi:MAG: VWA domain-containing protein [Saprospiraceae bacterium]
MNLSFEHIEYLWALLLIPLALLVWSQFRRFREIALGNWIDSSKSKSGFEAQWLIFLAAVCFIVASTNPRTPGKSVSVPQQKSDVMIVIDISKSMDAQDLAPSRLEVVKKSALKMIDELETERVGLVFFAGSAYLQMPLSSDVMAASLFLKSASTDQISDQGSDLNAALTLAMRAFRDTLGENDKTCIVYSDGESPDADMNAAIDMIEQSHMQVFTIGVGTTQGGPIPTPEGYLQDEDGKTVVTKLDDAVLKDIAEASGGKYVPIQSLDAQMQSIALEIASKKGTSKNSRTIKEYQSYFQFPLALGILYLILGWLGQFGIKLKRIKVDSKEIKMLTAVLIFLFSACFANAQSNHKQLRQGDKQYEAGKFEEAGKTYGKVENSQGQFNQGNAYYEQKKYDQAAKSFEKITQSSGADRELKQKAWYNLGNSQFKLEDYKSSVQSYENTLALNPKDQAAKTNLELAKLHLAKKKKEEEKKKEEDQKKKPDPNKDKKGQQGNQDPKQDKDQKDNKSQQDPKDQKQDQQNQDKQNQKPEKPKDQTEQDRQAQLYKFLDNEEKRIRSRQGTKSPASAAKGKKAW